MTTLSTLFLHSSRMYSGLADSVFADSVEQSQFASCVSSRRMETAKAIMGTSSDFEIELDDEDMEILIPESGWQTCIAFDNTLMRVMAQDERRFLPLLTGVFTAAHQGAAFMNSTIQTEHKMCLSCGGISEQWTCPVCGSERNWLVGADVPENTMETEPTSEATEMEISLPNLSFADFPPERPVQPKRWEVLFDEQDDDIFTATGLARPSLG